MKTIWRNILVFLILIIAIGAIFSSFNLETGKPKDIGISTLVSKIEADEVASIIVEGDIMTVTFKDESKGVTSKESRESLSELLANYGVPAEKIRALTIEVKQPSGFAYWFGMLAPIMLPIIILIAIIWFMMRQVQGANSKAMSFGQSGARQFSKNQKDAITFKDVAGVKEAKEELLEVVDFLRNPKKFAAVGAKIPKGALLMGPPGTGKTLIARAVAGETDAYFISISGPEIIGKFYGESEARLRKVFEEELPTARLPKSWEAGDTEISGAKGEGITTVGIV